MTTFPGNWNLGFASRGSGSVIGTLGVGIGVLRLQGPANFWVKQIEVQHA